MSMQTPTATDGYVLGRTPAEYERLRAQARVWDAATALAADADAHGDHQVPGPLLIGCWKRKPSGKRSSAAHPSSREAGAA